MNINPNLMKYLVGYDRKDINESIFISLDNNDNLHYVRLLCIFRNILITNYEDIKRQHDIYKLPFKDIGLTKQIYSEALQCGGNDFASNLQEARPVHAIIEKIGQMIYHILANEAAHDIIRLFKHKNNAIVDALAYFIAYRYNVYFTKSVDKEIAYYVGYGPKASAKLYNLPYDIYYHYDYLQNEEFSPEDSSSNYWWANTYYNDKERFIKFCETNHPVMIVDCENTEPTVFYNTVYHNLRNIEKIVLIDDTNKDSRIKEWRYVKDELLKREPNKVVLEEYDRIKAEKSSVDNRVIINILRAALKYNAQSLVLASSDSDFFPVVTLEELSTFPMCILVMQQSVSYEYLKKLVEKDNVSYSFYDNIADDWIDIYAAQISDFFEGANAYLAKEEFTVRLTKWLKENEFCSVVPNYVINRLYKRYTNLIG